MNSSAPLGQAHLVTSASSKGYVAFRTTAGNGDTQIACCSPAQTLQASQSKEQQGGPSTQARTRGASVAASTCAGECSGAGARSCKGEGGFANTCDREACSTDQPAMAEAQGPEPRDVCSQTCLPWPRRSAAAVWRPAPRRVFGQHAYRKGRCLLLQEVIFDYQLAMGLLAAAWPD